MVTAADLAAAAEAFMAAPKILHGSQQPYTWGPGYSQHEVVAHFPIEVDGELRDGARLTVVGFPQAMNLKFRLCLCCGAALCRLDYTDEVHPNTLRGVSDDIPSIVDGPHYHSWPLNRRFFKGALTAPKLHNAEEFLLGTSFDSILRWFCTDVNIASLPGGHLIALPTRDTLL